MLSLKGRGVAAGGGMGKEHSAVHTLTAIIHHGTSLRGGGPWVVEARLISKPVAEVRQMISSHTPYPIVYPRICFPLAITASYVGLSH